MAKEKAEKEPKEVPVELPEKYAAIRAKWDKDKKDKEAEKKPN